MVTLFGLEYASIEFALFELSQLNLSDEKQAELDILTEEHLKNNDEKQAEWK